MVKWWLAEMWEDVVGQRESQGEPDRARRYKDCGQRSKEDNSLENASGKGTPEPQRKPIKLSRAQPSWKIGAFPSFYHWRSSGTTLRLDFKASSPLSHKLTEIQLEIDPHLAMEPQASETQTCKLMTNIEGQRDWVHKTHDLLLLILHSYPPHPWPSENYSCSLTNSLTKAKKKKIF